MIHAFAIEPKLVATWGRLEEFRLMYDKFGLGTPRALLELPAFSKWKRAVYDAAQNLALPDEDMKRIEELFRILAENKCRRVDSLYDGLLTWLENAEAEFRRKPFAGIIAFANPRNSPAVLLPQQLDPASERWVCPSGASPQRTPEVLAGLLTPMLTNCRQLHLIDPNFGPENARHRKILEAFMNVLASHGAAPEVLRVHCGAKSTLTFFEDEATKMASHLPAGLTVEFVRWRQKDAGEKLHNRYVLTDLGGVTLGVGLDEGRSGETDDVTLLTRPQYDWRWSQYVGADNTFYCVDRPSSVVGTRARR